MDAATIAAIPKAVLHEHLDGGLRPLTIVELADATGYPGLPTLDPDALADWFVDAVQGGGLPGYLSTFAHTVGVMQTADAIERVAYESAVDLASAGVVYAEVRFAPELNTARGLSLDDVIEAALAGIGRAGRDRIPIEVGLIVDGMRSGDRTAEAAAAAVRWAGAGVVGYDIAGPEEGFPPVAHQEAFDVARRGGLGITIHAGEAYGAASIAQAVHECGAQRLGHGVRIAEDYVDGSWGELSTFIRDRGIPLELCPRSNVDTGAVASLKEHPIDWLLRSGFAVTLNCDNRLMSATGPIEEVEGMVSTFGWGLDELEQVTVTAVEAAFQPEDVRRRILDQVVRPGYALARLS